MAIFDIFSKREQRRSGSKPDVFKYDSLPQELRVQIVLVLTDLLGKYEAGYQSPAQQVYRSVHNALAREYGVFQLAKGSNFEEILYSFILQTPDLTRVLDAIELSVAFVTIQMGRTHYKTFAESKIDDPSVAISEINQRFLEAGIGYQYESGEFIKVDSLLLHSEAVKPVLVLLSDKRFAGAEQEFLRAHKHYREGSYKECLTECLKAFESTMKSICEIKNWRYDKGDTAKTLIDVLFQHGLVPPMLQSQFNNLRPLLETGIPVMRNKSGAHGQGPVPTDVPSHVAAYGMHLTAANILFLVKTAGC